MWWGIWVRRAALTILCWLCSQFHIDHETIRWYVNKRDEWHLDATLETGMTARACKGSPSAGAMSILTRKDSLLQ